MKNYFIWLSLLLVPTLAACQTNHYNPTDRYVNDVEVVVQFQNLSTNDADLIRWNVLKDHAQKLNANDSMSLIYKQVNITNTAYFFQNAKLHMVGNFYMDQNSHFYSSILSKPKSSRFDQPKQTFTVGDSIVLNFQDHDAWNKQITGKVIEIKKL